LNSKDGLSVCTSHDYTFENGTPLNVICFWGTIEEAISCKVDGWSGHQDFVLDLAPFMENWCVGLDEDSHLIGLNFNANLSGIEVRPLELLLDIIKYLKTNKIFVNLSDFKNIIELEKTAQKLIEE
jgi:hypothetical protein